MEGRSARLLAWLLLAAAVRAACAQLPPAPLNPALPGHGPPTLVPDLAHDGAERLAWLPGLGQGGAADLVAARPGLGVPLSLATLRLVPGIGETTAREIAAFYARLPVRTDGQAPPSPAPDR